MSNQRGAGIPANYQQVLVVDDRSNGSGTAGGVLGIVGFVLSWIPLLGILLGFILGLLAVIFGGIGLAKRGGHGMAITGLVLGILTIIFKLIPGINLL